MDMNFPHKALHKDSPETAVSTDSVGSGIFGALITAVPDSGKRERQRRIALFAGDEPGFGAIWSGAFHGGVARQLEQGSYGKNAINPTGSSNVKSDGAIPSERSTTHVPEKID